MWRHTRRNQISSFARNGPSPFKCDDTCAETRFRLSRETDRVHLNRPGGGASVQSTAGSPRCAASAVVMLDTPCSEVVWRVLATHCIRQFPLQFPSRAPQCAITFQLESTYLIARSDMWRKHTSCQTHKSLWMRLSFFRRSLLVRYWISNTTKSVF